MFIDARSLPHGTVVDADLCVIGAGAAGISIALQFAGTATKVVLLESGGLSIDWEVQALYRGQNGGLPYFDLDVCQLRFFGGNTNAWGGWCRPLDPIDFRTRPWVEDSGWPFSHETLAPYYRAAHALCELPSDDYRPEVAVGELAERRARLLPFDPKKLETSIYRFSTPTRFGQAYRATIGSAANIHCFLQATALGLRAAPDARSVSAVLVGTFAGNRFQVAARHYVLAAGGIENARLLLLSNDVAPRGLGNDHDVVGRYFMEHPHTKRTLLAARRPAPTTLYGLTFRKRAVAARLSLPAAVQEREALLNYSANIHPVYVGHRSSAWLALRKLVLSISRSRRSDPFIRFPPYGRRGLSPRQLIDILLRPDQVAVAGLLQLLQPDRLVASYLLESKPEQAPNRESRVMLDHDRDALGLNRVRLLWRTLPIDRRTAVRGEEIVDGELRRLGIGQLAPLARGEIEEWPTNLEGGWHQIGTTRAHADPKRGVVDGNGAVHGVANLFIAGGSVFPTGGVAPPTLTVVALALRLADHLRHALAPDRAAAVTARADGPIVAPALAQ